MYQAATARVERGGQEVETMRVVMLRAGRLFRRLHPRERWLRAEERRLRVALGEDWVQRRLA